MSDRSRPGRPRLFGAAPIESGVIFILLAAVMIMAFGWDRVLVSLVPLMGYLALMNSLNSQTLLLPDVLAVPAALVSVPLLAVASTSSWPSVLFGRALLGGLVVGFAFFAAFVVAPSKIGFGTVKFAPTLGAHLALFGWNRVALAGAILAATVGLLAAIASVSPTRREVPVAPLMGAAVVIALVAEGLG